MAQGNHEQRKSDIKTIILDRFARICNVQKMHIAFCVKLSVVTIQEENRKFRFF